jgi:hypothetical protein
MMARATPIEIFEDNISDAHLLLAFARSLKNTRARRMRAELQERFGEAMNVGKKRRGQLDCVESDDVFLILKPGRELGRELFTEPQLRPLLRQSIVAVGAAVETYASDKACCYLSDALGAEKRPARLDRVSLTLGDLLRMEERYVKRGWGRRELVRKHIEDLSSSDPDVIGRVFSMVGKEKFWGPVDQHRKVTSGTSHTQLAALSKRRNKIAHAGDRQGTGRAALSLSEAESHLVNSKGIVEALEAVL